MDQQYEDAFDNWRASLHSLVSDVSRLALWQDRRYRFAHQVGTLLTEPMAGASPTTGPVLYGVFIPGAGLCYVGRTQEAGRRLRYLPVGESHHLANTVPPELWEKVVVLRWPDLVSSAPASEQDAVEEMSSTVCGLALEHLLQLATTPPLNSLRRDNNGAWRPRNQIESRSQGAIRSAALPELWKLTWQAWNDLATLTEPAGDVAVRMTEVGRVALPARISAHVPGE